MKDSKNNIDKFFAERLLKDTPEADWNMPSDKIWDAARVSFEEPKRNRKIWPFTLFGIIGLVGIMIYLNSGITNNTDPVSKTIVNNIADTQNQPKTFKKINSESNSQTDKQLKTIDSKSTKQTGLKTKANNVDSTNGVLQNTASKNVTSKANLVNDNSAVAKKAKVDANIKSKSIQVNKKPVDQRPQQKEERKPKENTTTTFQNFAANTDDKKSELDIAKRSTVAQIPTDTKEILPKDIALTETKISPQIEKQNATRLDNRMQSSAIRLASLNKNYASGAYQLSYERPIMSSEKMAASMAPIKPIPRVKRFPRYELGHSTTVYYFVDILASVARNNATESDELQFFADYSSFNFNASKWISPHWSVTTGIQYAEMNLGLSYFVNGIVDSDTDVFVQKEYNEIVRSAAIDVPDEREFSIELKSGADVMEGDEIQIVGVSNVVLEVIQIPLFFNYHWYTPKFEFFTGGGVSYDTYRYSVITSEFNVFRDGESLIDTFNESSDQGQTHFASAFAQVGMKYKILPQFNIGIQSKTSLINPLLSGLEIGLYYRWL